MVSIVACIGRIKKDLCRIRDRLQIERHCREAGYHPRQIGPLGPAATLGLFMQQILQGNVSCAAVRHWAGESFTPQAYCDARMRLPLPVVRRLALETAGAMEQAVGSRPEHRFNGHRVLLIDSSSYSMADTPQLQKKFGQPGMQKAGCGFPVAHWLALFNLSTGMAVDTLAAPLRTHEASEVGQIQKQMQPQDLVVGDDSFGTYAHLCLLRQRNLHGLFPTHHHRIVDFTPHRPCIEPGKGSEGKGLPRSRWIKKLGHNDQLVEWLKPARKPEWMTRAQWRKVPDSILVREVRRTIHRCRRRPITLTIVTTLLDPKLYPAKELFKVRKQRWNVEIDFRHLKTTMKMEVLHCRTVQGVLKEMWVYLLVYNLVRRVMLEAALRQKVSCDRISFADTLGWMRHAREGDELPKLIIVPYRPDRIEPRAVKRRLDRYARMTRPRQTMREEIQNV